MMKFLKVLMMSVALTVTLVGAQGLMAAAPIPDGLIKFAGHEDGSYKPCSLVLKTGEFAFNVPSDHGCVNDRMNYFQLDGAPSATLITLNDNSIKSTEMCDRTSGVLRNGWKYSLKTIKQPTTTKWIKIDDLHSMKVGDIVVAGLVLVSKDELGSSHDRIDELSCVRVQRSELP